jgi:hypothetical protein
MNIRIIAASALALTILVPAANAATPSREERLSARNDSSDRCPNGNLNLGTEQCIPFGAKVVHASVVKHVAKPVNTAFANMTAIQNSHNEL